MNIKHITIALFSIGLICASCGKKKKVESETPAIESTHGHEGHGHDDHKGHDH